ncbi:MAG TPA: CDP-alcohol phosphatidyltransferase family protein [Candidatus Limnocylindria bacterium]|nr:CDP-alcohol phosphatidyltransferase family protein [Candidatus Limnocylindria bacterium]
MAGADGFWARVARFRRTYQPSQGLFWIERVNFPAGALIALLLLPTRVSPNAVTLSGLAAYLVGAVVVAFANEPISIWVVIGVALTWQLAFSLDCADGSLARARGTASPFGAWFDQLIDSIARTAVYTAIIAFLVRALELPALASVVLSSLSVALALLQTFSSWQRAAVIGGPSPVDAAGGRGRALLSASRHLEDYGAFLFLAAVLLLVPTGLLAFMVGVAVVHALFVAAQLALAWRRHARERRRAA